MKQRKLPRPTDFIVSGGQSHPGPELVRGTAAAGADELTGASAREFTGAPCPLTLVYGLMQSVGGTLRGGRTGPQQLLLGRHPADSSGMGIVLLGAAGAVATVWYLLRRRTRLNREARDAQAASDATGVGA